MKQQVKRITLTKTSFEEIEFSTKGNKYLVKNFSDGDIFVSLDKNAKEENSIKIPSKFFQVVVGNEYMSELGFYETSSIFIKGNGEIEVQQLWYH